jgi:hypothetical protein
MDCLKVRKQQSQLSKQPKEKKKREIISTFTRFFVVVLQCLLYSSLYSHIFRFEHREVLTIWATSFVGLQLTFSCIGAALVFAIFFALIPRGAHFMSAGFVGLQLCYYVFLLIYSASRYVLSDMDETSISITVALFMAFVVTLLSGR